VTKNEAIKNKNKNDGKKFEKDKRKRLNGTRIASTEVYKRKHTHARASGYINIYKRIVVN